MLQMKKAWLKCFLLGSILVISFTAAVFADDVGQVRSESAEVLAEPFAGAEIVTGLQTGQPVRILERSDDFYKISFGSQEAYVSPSDLTVVAADGVVNDTRVNIRDYPTLDSEIIGRVNTNEIYTAKGICSDWYMIDYGGQTAYIHRDYFDGYLLRSLSPTHPEPKIPVTWQASPEVQESIPVSKNSDAENVFAVVTSDTGLNLRNDASKGSQVIQILRNGTVLDVLDVGGEWIEVSYNGTVGYVNTEFVSLSIGEPAVASSTRAEEVIAYARQFLGTPYKYAGNNLNSGVDCSGFVYAVMKHFGVSLNRSSRDMVRNGANVSKSQLMAGDLVFFDTNGGANKGNISHVGIYIGNNSFIHSSSSRRTWGVVISSLNEDYYVRTYVSAVRVLS